MTIEFVPQVEEKLSPIERLEALCDPGSLTLLRSDVRSRRMGEKARAGDGVIAGAGRVDGRPVFCYAQDPSYLGGSLGEQHAESIVRVLKLAGRAGAPVVGFIESGGARMRRASRRSRATRGSSGSTSRSRARSRRSPSSAAPRPAAAPTPRRSPTSS
jgi:acetyl-CoA carboxylase carboxyltransferase component